MRKALLVLLFCLLAITFLIYGISPCFLNVKQHQGKSILAGGVRELNSSGFSLFCNYGYLCEHGQTPDYRSYSVIPTLYLAFNDTVFVEEVSFDGISQHNYNWGKERLIYFTANEFNKYEITNPQNSTKPIRWQIYRKTAWTTRGNPMWASLGASGFCVLSCLLMLRGNEKEDKT